MTLSADTPLGYNFRLSPGVFFPEDGGYVILSALCAQFPWLHGRRNLQIAPVRGARTSRKNVLLTDNYSVLHVRGLSTKEIVDMEEKTITIYNQPAKLSRGSFVEVDRARAVVTRIVTFDGAKTESSFLEKLVAALPACSAFRLGRQRTFSLKGITYMGFGVHVGDLTEEESEKIQRSGIGRFTSMGCGVFKGAREL